MFNLPGLPPNGDPRTPDIVITSNVGVIYTGHQKKVMEHGGFARDDTNVMMLLAAAVLSPATITSPVETTQIAPTILKALGLDPHDLDAVRREHTQALAGLPRLLGRRSLGHSGKTRSPNSVRTSRRPGTSSQLPGTEEVPKRARTPPAVAGKGLEKPRAGFLVQDEGHGLGVGREGRQHAPSASRNSAMALSR